MSTPFLPGQDPAQIVKGLRELADALDSLAAGGGPTAGDLVQAPVLSRWHPATLTRPALVGVVSGHPRLGDRPIRTSEIYALDLDAGWARTWSRFYRLGSSLSEAVG